MKKNIILVTALLLAGSFAMAAVSVEVDSTKKWDKIKGEIKTGVIDNAKYPQGVEFNVAQTFTVGRKSMALEQIHLIYKANEQTTLKMHLIPVTNASSKRIKIPSDTLLTEIVIAPESKGNRRVLTISLPQAVSLNSKSSYAIIFERLNSSYDEGFRWMRTSKKVGNTYKEGIFYTGGKAKSSGETDAMLILSGSTK